MTPRIGVGGSSPSTGPTSTDRSGAICQGPDARAVASWGSSTSAPGGTTLAIKSARSATRGYSDLWTGTRGQGAYQHEENIEIALTAAKHQAGKIDIRLRDVGRFHHGDGVWPTCRIGSSRQPPRARGRARTWCRWREARCRFGRCRLVAAQPRRIVRNRPTALKITVRACGRLSEGLTDRRVYGGNHSEAQQDPVKAPAGKSRKSAQMRHRVDHKIGKPLTAMHIICAT